MISKYAIKGFYSISKLISLFVPRTNRISEFFYFESLVLSGFYIDLPGVVIWQHIHPSTLHSR